MRLLDILPDRFKGTLHRIDVTPTPRMLLAVNLGKAGLTEGSDSTRN